MRTGNGIEIAAGQELPALRDFANAPLRRLSDLDEDVVAGRALRRAELQPTI